MISHVFLGVKNFERALDFYEKLMATLGYQLLFVNRERPWAGWRAATEERPIFLIGYPFNRDPHESGNGQMIAIFAQNRDDVDRAHAIAIRSGGACEGPPGIRAEYHDHYYGAYFRDTEGNKLCVVNHQDPQV